MPSKDSDNHAKKKKKKNTSLRLEKDMLKQLKRIALEEDTSIQEIIEGLISSYLEGLTKPAKPEPRTKVKKTKAETKSKSSARSDTARRAR